MRSPLPLLAAAACCGLFAPGALADDMAGDTAVATKAEVRLEGPVRVMSSGAVELRSPLGSDDVALFVRRAEPDHPSHTYVVYRGPDLATILDENAALAEHEDIVVLRSSIDNLAQAATPSAQEAPWRVSFVEGPVRYETWRGNGAILYVTTDGETLAYRGKDLDAIIAAHPALKPRPEIAVVRRHIALLPEYRLRTQPYANRIERAAWLDMTVKPDTTEVIVYETTPQGTWTKHTWSGKDYRDIARAEAGFRARGPLWFDLDFGAELPDLPPLPDLPNPFN